MSVITKNISFAFIALVVFLIILIYSQNFNHSESKKILENKGKASQRIVKNQFFHHTSLSSKSEIEFEFAQVKLPIPINGYWKGPFFDSKDYNESREKRRWAVEVLPGWIRKAVLTDEGEKAAKYLFTLIEIAENSNDSLGIEAALALYRLGDYKNTALNAMSEVLTSDEDKDYSDFYDRGSQISGNEQLDPRQVILNHLQFYKDSRLDSQIYQLWEKNGATDKLLGIVDYAYYLEQTGNALPVDYWMDRLEMNSYFDNAVNVIKDRRSEFPLEDLVRIFRISSEQQWPPIARNKSPMLASVLFNMTQIDEFKQYLYKKANLSLSGTRDGFSVEQVFYGIADIGDPESILILENAVSSDLKVLAMKALGRTQSPQATLIISREALREAKRNIFPRDALNSLVMQNTKQADTYYSDIRNGLITGAYGWQAVENDFKMLDFIKENLRD